MAYIKPPPPGDDEVIFTDRDGKDYTWGEHRAMEKALKELEAVDADVSKARARLDYVLTKYGVNTGHKPVVLICEHCGKSEYVRHEETCPDYLKDLPVTREAGAYQYLTDKFEVVHTTSAPLNDEEALAHFGLVQLMFPKEGPDFWVRYIMRREMHENEFKMMPWQFNKDVWEVFPIVRPS